MNAILPLILLLALGSTAQAADPHADHHPAGAKPQPQQASVLAEVRSVDRASGLLDVAHGPIAALSWPAMQMEFSATPGQLQNIEAGDWVELQIAVENGVVQLLEVREVQP